MLQQDQKTVDKIGRDVVVGDRIAVAHCEIDGEAYLSLAHVLRIREDGVLETLEDPYRGARGPRRTTRRPEDVLVAPRDPDQPMEQFLPADTTFEAKYAVFGRYSFTVLDDGRIRDNDGDEAPMDAIDIQSMRDIQLPAVQR